MLASYFVYPSGHAIFSFRLCLTIIISSKVRVYFLIVCIKLHQHSIALFYWVIAISFRRCLLIRAISKFCIKALLPFLLGLLHIGLGVV
jgi:hypothetical protein